MDQLEMVMFVARLQLVADFIAGGAVDRAILEFEKRRRDGHLPLMGDAAYQKFLAFLRELAALKPSIESIAKDGANFEKIMRAGATGQN